MYETMAMTQPLEQALTKQISSQLKKNYKNHLATETTVKIPKFPRFSTNRILEMKRKETPFKFEPRSIINFMKTSKQQGNYPIFQNKKKLSATKGTINEKSEENGGKSEHTRFRLLE